MRSKHSFSFALFNRYPTEDHMNISEHQKGSQDVLFRILKCIFDAGTDGISGGISVLDFGPVVPSQSYRSIVKASQNPQINYQGINNIA